MKPSSDRIAASFLPAIEGPALRDLEGHPESVYGLAGDLTLAYLNPAWFGFAEASGADLEFFDTWSLGAPVLEAIGAPLRSFFEEAYTRILESSKTWIHDYMCHSPNQLRCYHMQVYPLSEHRGLLVVNSLVVAQRCQPDEGYWHALEESAYRDEQGILLQCSQCRRFRRVEPGDVWDWVPAWVEEPLSGTSGGLCRTCFQLHYPTASWPEDDPGA